MTKASPQLKGYIQEATAMGTLVDMLTTCRPQGSKVEKQFIRHFIAPLGAVPDGKGNYVLRIGDEPILWSCHTDTVHSVQGFQRLSRFGQFTIGLDKSSHSSCLGADDTAGIWLMREMILAKKPGLYVFHRAEEIGCVGSKWLAKNNPKLLKGIKFAVALDRKGTEDVITHQMGRCCSDEFATSLAAQLGMKFKPSPNGVYTDTKSYVGLIGECTNISVGYYNQHGKTETLDAEFLAKLRHQLLQVDVSKLVEKRKAGEVESYSYNYGTEYDYDDYGFGGTYYGGRGRRSSYSHFSVENYRVGYWSKEQNKFLHGYYHDPMAKYGEFSCWEEYFDEYYGTDRYGHRDLSFKPPRAVYLNSPVIKKEDTNVLPFSNTTMDGVRESQRKDVTTHHIRYGDSIKTDRQQRSEIDEILERDAMIDADDFSSGNARFTLQALCRNHPEEVADYLEGRGEDPADIALYINEVLGYVITK